MIDISVHCSDYGRNQRACMIYEHGQIVEFVDLEERDDRTLDEVAADIERAYRAGDSSQAIVADMLLEEGADG